MSDPTDDLDPVTLSVIRGRTTQLTNEMDLTLVNSAFSPIICEANDMANGIYRPDGNTVAQGGFGLPIFVGNMEFTVAAVADRFGDDLEAGDIIATNDPYLGGTHLNDITLVKPVFREGELLTFIANTGHWTDVGGASPGGFTGETTSIYAEGLRIPPMKVVEGGEPNESFPDLIRRNVRRPEDILGDYKAQLNALQVGEDRLTDLLDEYGPATIQAAIEELERRSETEMRSHTAEIPDGIYRFTDYMDNDGIVDEPLPIELTMTIDGSDVRLDFTGSAPPCEGPMNLPKSCTVSACNILFKHVFPEIPINAGCFAPLEFVIPEETFLNASPPRPVSGYTETAQRVLDVAMGALAQAIPEQVPAQAYSSSAGMSLSGETDDGEYVMSYAVAGGYGASKEEDGLSHATPPYARARMPSVEVLEEGYPVRFHEKALRPDSEGAGRRRGGFGTIYEIEVLDDEATYSTVGDRADHVPSGVAGGLSAAGATFEFVRDGKTYAPPLRTKTQDLDLSRSDRIRIESPGGGGYGDPTSRETARVRRDVRLGYITPDRARDVYGVDVERTERNERRRESTTSDRNE